jgi:hypothetical protein
MSKLLTTEGERGDILRYAGHPIQYQVDGDNPKVEGQEFF